jgi:GWxTD domain-containing protein
MRRQRLVILFYFVVALFLQSAAQAQLSEEYADWAEGPEAWLLTKKEKKEWEKISTDAQAERFIELFWARRNPEPNASFNSFKAEWESKVRFADENFGYANHRGALSDRGRVLLLLGRPEGRDLRGGDQVPSPAGATDADAAVGRTDIWVYEAANLPKEFKAKGGRLLFVFYEERTDSNNFALDRSNRESFKGMSSLARAPEVYLLHPNLTEVPKPISVAGASPASAAHLAWLEGGAAPFDDIVIVMSELGVKDDVSRPLWLHFELPPDAPPLDLIVGRVTDSGGEVVSNFEMPAAPLEGQYGSVYHLSFSLEEGSYTVDFVGAAKDAPQVNQSFEAEVSAVPEDGTWMSPLWLGLSATPNREAKLGDAFTIGGWHLMPISGPELQRSSEIAYFGFVVRPALNEEGAVKLRAKVQLTRDGKPLGRPLIMPLDSSHMFGDLHMFGNSIGLTALPEAGPYDFEFEVTETVSETTSARALAIQITE